jgi:hypothetical protein
VVAVVELPLLLLVVLVLVVLVELAVVQHSNKTIQR